MDVFSINVWFYRKKRLRAFANKKDITAFSGFKELEVFIVNIHFKYFCFAVGIVRNEVDVSTTGGDEAGHAFVEEKGGGVMGVADDAATAVEAEVDDEGIVFV